MNTERRNRKGLTCCGLFVQKRGRRKMDERMEKSCIG